MLFSGITLMAGSMRPRYTHTLIFYKQPVISNEGLRLFSATEPSKGAIAEQLRIKYISLKILICKRLYHNEFIIFKLIVRMLKQINTRARDIQSYS